MHVENNLKIHFGSQTLQTIVQNIDITGKKARIHVHVTREKSKKYVYQVACPAALPSSWIHMFAPATSAVRERAALSLCVKSSEAV